LPVFRVEQPREHPCPLGAELHHGLLLRREVEVFCNNKPADFLCPAVSTSDSTVPPCPELESSRSFASRDGFRAPAVTCTLVKLSPACAELRLEPPDARLQTSALLLEQFACAVDETLQFDGRRVEQLFNLIR
jgi:hypothetical protein